MSSRFSADTGQDARGYGRYSCPDCVSDMAFWLWHRDGIGRPHLATWWQRLLHRIGLL